MNTIWKYPLKIMSLQLVSMPVNAEFLCIQNQNGVPTLWAKVDTSLNIRYVQRVIKMCGTGQAVEGVGKYLGTCQIDEMVWHYFEAV